MPDAFDPGLARVHNSPIPAWPVTAALTKLEFRPEGVSVEFSKKDCADRWPDVTPPGWTGPIQYTLWIGMRIIGEWHIAGILEYWYGLDASGGNVIENNQIAINWTYDCDVMKRQPLPGERVAFLVTAGSQRQKEVFLVHERSQVVTVPFPATLPAVFTFDEAVPDPVPIPVPPSVDLGPLYARIAYLERRLTAHEAAPQPAYPPLPDYIGVAKVFGYPITVRSKPLYE